MTLTEELTAGFKTLPLLLHNVLAIKCVNIGFLPGFEYSGGLKVLVDSYMGSRAGQPIMPKGASEKAFTVEATCSITGNILGLMYIEKEKYYIDGEICPYLELLVSARENYNRSFCREFSSKYPVEEKLVKHYPPEASFMAPCKPYAKTHYASGMGTILLYLLSNITKHLFKNNAYCLSTLGHEENNDYYLGLGLSGPHRGNSSFFNAGSLPCPAFDKVLRYIKPDNCHIPDHMARQLLSIAPYSSLPKFSQYRNAIAFSRKVRQKTKSSRFIPK